jgi:peptide-methionine (R)-S-oxide reductase
MSDTPANTKEEEWKNTLTPEQYAVLRCSETEPPFANAYWNCKDDGTYLCAGCGAELFSSEEKYDSGTGWPSYTAPLYAAAVETAEDSSHGMQRTEARCARCGGHLGHVFPDGPGPTGERYCINSTALNLQRSSR